MSKTSPDMNVSEEEERERTDETPQAPFFVSPVTKEDQMSSSKTDDGLSKTGPDTNVSEEEIEWTEETPHATSSHSAEIEEGQMTSSKTDGGLSKNSPDTNVSEEEEGKWTEKAPHTTSSDSAEIEEDDQMTSSKTDDGRSTKRKKKKRRKRKKEQPTGFHGQELDMEAMKEQYQPMNRGANKYISVEEMGVYYFFLIVSHYQNCLPVLLKNQQPLILSWMAQVRKRHTQN
jgi:hypothetical protein